MPTEVRVTLRAVPASAQFSIDGGPWLDNPHVRRVKVDRKRHEIKVRAGGYEGKTIVVPFDEDVALDVTLEKKSKRRGAGRPVPVPGPISDALPTPVRPKPRPLASGDPWGND